MMYVIQDLFVVESTLSSIFQSMTLFHLYYLFCKDVQIGQRMITISTVGVPNTIKMLASHKLQSTLAVRYAILSRRRVFHITVEYFEFSLSVIGSSCVEFTSLSDR